MSSGWNDWPEVFTEETPCMLTEKKGYVVYSSLGSFFIPLFLILFLYFKIFITQRQMMAKKKKKSKKVLLSNFFCRNNIKTYLPIP